MNHIIHCFMACLFFTAFQSNVFAQTLYVHDNVRVDMRSGPGNEYRITQFLNSGTKLESLQESGDWVEVKAGGNQGWIQKQYTTDQPIAREMLTKALSEMDALKKENQTLKQQLSSTDSQFKELKSTHTKMSDSTEHLQKELDKIQQTSRNAIATESAYRALQEETELLKVDLEKLRMENIRLEDNNVADGIKWGIAAVLFGVLLAWLISKSTGKKRRSEW